MRLTFIGVFFLLAQNICAQTNDLESKILDEVINPYIQNLNFLVKEDCTVCREYKSWINLFENNSKLLFNDLEIEGVSEFSDLLSPREYLIFSKKIWSTDFELDKVKKGNVYFQRSTDGKSFVLRFCKVLSGTLNETSSNIQYPKWVSFIIDAETFKIKRIENSSTAKARNNDEDTDGDFVIDRYDACVGEIGTWCTDGCLDQDNDCVSNFEDECLTKAGLIKCNGCPDTDGDGVCDQDEYKDENIDCTLKSGLGKCGGCPDTDGDGVCDQDEYKDENIDCTLKSGLGKCGGCPDTDGDGLCDQFDECPEEDGPMECNGCPHSDTDGICDNDDECPDIPGTKECKGCPDNDGDGIRNRDDRCPNEKGNRNNDGCPKPQAPAKLMVSLFPIVSLPIGNFSSNSVKESDQNEIQIPGLSSAGYGGGITIEYNFSRILGLSMSTNYLVTSFNSNNYNTILKEALNSNNIIFNDVFSSSNAYQAIAILGGISIGNFVEPHGLKIEPTVGILVNSFFNNELATRINFANQDAQISTVKLFNSNPLVYGGNLRYSYSRKKVGYFIKVSYLKSMFSASPSSFLVDNSNLEIRFDDIKFSLVNISIGVHLYLAKK